MKHKKPRERRKAKNLDMILDTAAGLIVAEGIENVSLREIARQADYSPAGLYKYFDDKASIFIRLLSRENANLVDQLKTVSPDLPSDKRLIEACLVYIRYNLENPAYPILLNTLSSERKRTSDPLPENSPYTFFLEAVQAWVLETNILLEDTYGPEEITYTLWAMVHGMAMLRLKQLKDFEADFETVNRKSLQTYLNGLKK